MVLTHEGQRVKFIRDQTNRDFEPMTHNLALTSDYKYVLLALMFKPTVCVRNTDGKDVHRLEHDGLVTSIVVTSDNQFIITATSRPLFDVCVWCMADGTIVRRLQGHTYIVRSVAVSSDSVYIVSGGQDNTMRIWRLADGTELQTVRHPHWVNCVAVTPDNRHIVTGCGDGIVRLFSLTTGTACTGVHPECTLVREFEGHANGVLSVAVSLMESTWFLPPRTKLCVCGVVSLPKMFFLLS